METLTIGLNLLGYVSAALLVIVTIHSAAHGNLLKPVSNIQR